MPAGGLVVAGVVGAGTAIYGAIQKNKAAKAARNNIMPHYDIPQSEYNSLNLAESQAGQGMSDASRQQLLNNSQSGLSATQNAILRSGGSANAIAGAEDKYQQGINQNAIYDDQARMANLSRLQSAYTRMSADADKSYQINEYAPWANRAQAISQQLQSGQQTMQSGLSTLGSAATSYAAAMAKPGTNNNIGLRDTSGDVSMGKIPTYGSYGSANSSPSPSLSIPDSGFQQQQVPWPAQGGDAGSASVNNNFTTWGNGSGSQWKWNGFYPEQQY